MVFESIYRQVVFISQSKLMEIMFRQQNENQEEYANIDHNVITFLYGPFTQRPFNV